MPLKIAAFTMAHNEHRMLPLWMRHYSRMLGSENIFLIDHGSDDGSTDPFADNRLRLPRKYNGADLRLPIVSGIQRTLLQEYDVVIYTDCDEFLVVDPDKYSSLEVALENHQDKYIRCLGANIVHIPSREPGDLDFDKPILEQRQYWYYIKSICKPIITRAEADWVPGFHFVRGMEGLRPNPAFLLLHMRWADRAHALDRMRMTRTMEWSPKAMKLGWGAHARQTDDEVLQFFRGKEVESSRDGHQFIGELMDDVGEPERIEGPVRQVYSRLRSIF